jgi:hypothetical protein
MRYIILVIIISVLAGCTPASNPHSNKEEEIYNKLTNALLNERLQLEVVRMDEPSMGCTPREPYYKLSAKRRDTEPYLENPGADDGGTLKTRKVLKETDIAEGIALIESTGKIKIMDICLE